MAVASRQKQGRKGLQDSTGPSPASRGGGAARNAWRSGTPNNYSPAMNANARLPPSQQQSNGQQGFPPLGQANRAQEPAPQILAALAGQVGNKVVITMRNGRHEGTLTTVTSEGDSQGIVLNDVKDVGNPSAPIKDTFFIPSSSLVSWAVAETPKPNGLPTSDSFRTDKDITSGPAASAPSGRRERELQAWQPGGADPGAPSVGRGDDATFGAGVSGGSWDQFAANEQLFGVKTHFDEDAYTTKLDRSGADFKDRERKAQQIANEIMNSSTNNAHVAEERQMNSTTDTNGTTEEDKYGAVVRAPNAYIPPGARKAGITSGAAAPSTPSTKPEPPKVSVNGPSPVSSKQGTPTPASAATSPAQPGQPGQPGKPADDLVGSFRDFVTNEKQRLAQKRHAIVKNEMDKRLADLVKFSQSFKLNKPIPDDLVPILAKDEEKQKAIREKSTQDAESSNARSIGAPSSVNATASASRPIPATPATGPKADRKVAAVPKPPASSKPKDQAATGVAPPPPKAQISMVIQKIPPFNPEKFRQRTGQIAASASNQTPQPPASPTASASSSNSNAFKLNAGASSFKPNPNASAFKPTTPGSPAASSPKTKTTEPSAQSPVQPNPFFGTRPIKKGTPVHIKDDFNPFKFAKVAEASAVSAIWPYNGKRYLMMFPLPPPQPHAPAPMPPPSYEEDSAAQAARFGVMYYPYHQYPGQPPPQQMMVPASAPPGGYIPAQFMQPMGYPPMAPPNGPPTMYGPPPAMGTIPPQQYMQPPPGAYPPPPPPPGAPRGSMPPTPMPAHAHAYAYHQSPQLAHAVPYMMMQPPPPGAPQHPYESGPAGPVPMGGPAH